MHDLTRRYSVIVVSGVDLASTKRRRRAEETNGLVMVENKMRSQEQSERPASCARNWFAH